MATLTESQLIALDNIWKYETIDDDRYEDDWKLGFNSAARTMRAKIQAGADAKTLKAQYDFNDLSDERWNDDGERGAYAVYRAVDAVLQG